MNTVAKRPVKESLASEFLRRRRRDTNLDVLDFLKKIKKDRGELSNTDLVAVLAIEQEERWRKGQLVPVETFLRIHESLAPIGHEAFDLIYAEYLLREERGETPSIDEFSWRFPQHRALLEEQLAFHHALNPAPPPPPSTHSFHSLANDRGGKLKTKSDRTSELGSTLPSWEPEGGFDHELLFQPLGFEVLEEIGRGAMGIVYKARQAETRRLVALKVFRGGQLAAPADRDRFVREAELAARLQHPNFVQIFEIRAKDAVPFMVLEYVEGASLDEAMAGVPLHPRDAARLASIMARAMHEAHLKGVVHRDLKPSNVLLLGDRREPIGRRIPKITDFGLAKRMDSVSLHGGTISGDVVGTPCYMAPEQALGQSHKAGPAADIYSLGALLYEMLTGRPPFRSETAVHVLQQVISDEPAPPRQWLPSLSQDLDTICLTCLNKQPEQRYASALALAEDLDRFLEGKPIMARKSPFWERAIKQVRRKPAVALLSISLALALTVGLAGLALAWRTAIQKAGDERVSKQHAQLSEQQARETAWKLENTLYGYRILQASQSWDSGDFARYRELLEETNPRINSGLFRRWEWLVLDRRGRSALWTDSIPVSPNSWIGPISSHDGSKIAMAWSNPEGTSTVRIWDESQGQVIRDIKVSQTVNALAFDPKDRMLAVLELGKAQVFEIETGKSIRSLNLASASRSLVFGRTSDELIIGDQSGSIEIWRLGTNQKLKRIASALGSVQPKGLVFHQNMTNRFQTKLAALYERGVVVYDGSTWDPIQTWSYSQDQFVVRAIGFDCNENLQGIVSKSDLIQIGSWNDLLKPESKKRLDVVSDECTTAVFSADGSQAILGSRNGLIRVIDSKTGQEEAQRMTMVDHRISMDPIARLEIVPDGLRLVAVSGTGVLQSLDLTWGSESNRFAKRIDDIAAIGFETFPGERRLHVLTWSGRLAVYDAKDGSLLDETFAEGLERPKEGSRTVLISEDGRLVAFVAGSEHRDLITKPTLSGSSESRKDQGTPLALAVRLPWPIRAITIARDSSKLAAACWPDSGSQSPGEIQIWSLKTGQMEGKLILNPTCPRPSRLALHPRESKLAMASLDGVVAYWDQNPNHQPRALASTQSLGDIAFSPDGMALAITDRTGILQLRDGETGRVLKGWQDSSGLDGLGFSPDGRLLATANREGIRLWDFSGRQFLMSLKFPSTASNPSTKPGSLQVVFSSDGERLAAIQDGQVLAVWDGSEFPIGDENPPALLSPKRQASWLLNEARRRLENQDPHGARFCLEQVKRIPLDGVLARLRDSVEADLPPVFH